MGAKSPPQTLGRDIPSGVGGRPLAGNIVQLDGGVVVAGGAATKSLRGQGRVSMWTRSRARFDGASSRHLS